MFVVINEASWATRTGWEHQHSQGPVVFSTATRIARPVLKSEILLANTTRNHTRTITTDARRRFS